MTEQPRTAAGRALLADYLNHDEGSMRSRILAIEAEMIPLVVREVPREKWEAQARPAVASEGLRAALTVIAGINESRVTVEQADALGYLDGYLQDRASDAGSVGALDVPDDVLDMAILDAAYAWGEDTGRRAERVRDFRKALAAYADAERQGEQVAFPNQPAKGQLFLKAGRSYFYDGKEWTELPPEALP